MNLLNVEPYSKRLLGDDECEAAALDQFEVELSPIDCQQPEHSDLRNAKRNIGMIFNFFGTTKGRLSEEIVRAIQFHHIREARNERRFKSCFSVALYTLGIILCVVPVGLFAVEMIPEQCKICLETVVLETYFAASAFCGGFGAMLVIGGDFWEYCLAKFLGGAVSSLGALFTIWMILQSIPSDSTIVALLVFIFVGTLAAMPGVAVYLLLKIVCDECWVSDIQDFADDFSSLTKLVTEEE